MKHFCLKTEWFDVCDCATMTVVYSTSEECINNQAMMGLQEQKLMIYARKNAKNMNEKNENNHTVTKYRTKIKKKQQTST